MKFSAVIALALSLLAHAVSLQGDVPSSAELGTASHMAPNGGPGFDQSFGPPDAGSILPDEQAEEDFSGTEPNMPFVGNALQKRQSAAFRTRFAPAYNRFGPRFQRWVLCVGQGLVWQCGGPILECAANGNPPWKCPKAIACGGETFKRCAQ